MKTLVTLGATLCLSASFFMTSFAGWEQTGATWKYQNADNTYFSDGWHWIDGNSDNVAECYYFNADGTILISTTTPDNYMVNENGAWVVNGVVQTKEVTGIGTETTTPNQNQNSNQSNKNTAERHYDLGGIPDPSNYDDSDLGGVSGVQSEVRTY